MHAESAVAQRPRSIRHRRQLTLVTFDKGLRAKAKSTVLLG
jgi:hypothetical protein